MRRISVSAGAQRIALAPDGTTLYVASESQGAEGVTVALVTNELGSVIVIR